MPEHQLSDAKADDLGGILHPDSGPAYRAEPMAGIGQWTELESPAGVAVGVLYASPAARIIGYWPEDAERHLGAPAYAVKVGWALRTSAAQGVPVGQAWDRLLAQCPHAGIFTGDLADLRTTLEARDTP